MPRPDCGCELIKPPPYKPPPYKANPCDMRLVKPESWLILKNIKK
ncbi:MAG: hypothetical protein JWQ66_989 [Mucilaginibacter sp.]|jgi:hypothetical protein|nr:hypothetical protein [Mucilaginibacter sp.]